MQRLADLRSTVADLDSASALFNSLAANILKLEAKNAAFERRLADLKLIHERQTAELRDAIQSDSAELLAFIDANRALFRSPRKVKTSLGSFGLQTAGELAVSAPDKLLQTLLEYNYEDCFKTIRTLVKPAIRARLQAGETLPGVAIRAGDTAVYKVDRALIEQARQQQQEPVA